MKRKVNCVLLVDDDEVANYIHKFIIKEADFAEHILVVENGQKALNHLKSNNTNARIRPNLIFLDINMPGMDGWEFLEQFNLLDEALKDEVKVVMLTTSLNPDDRVQAEANRNIDHFISKHLTVELLHELRLQYLANEFKK